VFRDTWPRESLLDQNQNGWPLNERREERTQEDVDELCGGIHHVGTPKSEMSGITWMMVKRKSSNNDNPGGTIGGERGVASSGDTADSARSWTTSGRREWYLGVGLEGIAAKRAKGDLLYPRTYEQEARGGGAFSFAGGKRWGMSHASARSWRAGLWMGSSREEEVG
jgi:hypothetical protein